jgi:uncharacterized protein (TIGR03437 family)
MLSLILPQADRLAKIVLVAAVCESVVADWTAVFTDLKNAPALSIFEHLTRFGLGIGELDELFEYTPARPHHLSLKVKDSANVERLAGLLYAGPTQVNYQIPTESALGNAQVTVTSADRTTASGTIEIAALAPGLFSADANGKGVAAAFALRVKPDGSKSSEPVGQYDTGQGKYVTVPIDLGPETDQVFLVLFGTGIRGLSALSGVTVSIGGATSSVDFAGPEGAFTGLDQINVRLSRSLIGRGEVDVGLTVDGQATNNLRVSIR